MLPQEIKAKTSLYSAETNELVEQPVMDKPDYNDFGETFYVAFEAKLFEYNAHIASLRRIPCDTSCKGLWKDGQKVVEGKDYEVRFVYEPGHSLREMFAFPLVPVGEDLWEEFLQSVFDATGLNIANYPAGLKLLKSKYSLTKR